MTNRVQMFLKRFISFWARNLGISEQTVIASSKDTLIIAMVVLLLFSAGNYLWGGTQFVYIWLFCLTMWAILHIKKSTTTWSRFSEIDQRDSDFHDEVDSRIEALEKEIKKLKTMIKANSKESP